MGLAVPFRTHPVRRRARYGRRCLVAQRCPIQDISDTMGHKSTHVTETVYRHVIVPAIRGGATVMDDVFGEQVSQADLSRF